jgi:hypothetical protein
LAASTVRTAQATPNPAGVTYTTLAAVSCASAGSCEAGGDFGQTPQNPVLQALAEGWNDPAIDPEPDQG